MDKNILLGHLETLLGTSRKTSRGNYAFMCPNKCHSSKPKLEINLDTFKYQCWVCGGQKKGFRGNSIHKLFKQANSPQNLLEELNLIIPDKNVNLEVEYSDTKPIELPKEYREIHDIKNYDIIGRRAVHYLKQRGLTKGDILRYNIGYCDGGIYHNHIIIPSYDEDNKLNYFIARSLEDEPFLKYKNPPHSRNIIMFENLINWDLPVILCEGVFDAIAIRRNATPILGKNISKRLYEKIILNTEDIIIALDKDARTKALQLAKKFMNEGKNVTFLTLPDKDPSEMGFSKFNQLVHNTPELDFETLMELKLRQI